MATRKILASSLAVIAAGVVFAGTELAPFDTVSGFVASNQTSALSAPLTAAEGSRLVKTGEGTLTMPINTATPGGPVVDVAKGMVVAEGAGTDDSAAESFITSSALFWIAADADKAKFSTSGSGDSETVDCWYDVREADTSAPTRYCAKTPDSFVSPALRTVDGLRSVYFRGYKSKCTMRITKNDAVQILNIGSVFAVTRISNSVGQLFGNATSGHPYQTGAWNHGTVGLAYYDVWTGPHLRNSKFYDNGVRRDVKSDYVQKGVRIYEFHHQTTYKGCMDSLFCQGTDINREGGDDLMELVLFSDPISESDRLAVLQYLARKWNVPGDVSFRTGSDATVKLRPSSPAPSRISGSGTYLAETTGMTLSTGTDIFFGGLVDIAPGVSAISQSPALAYAIGAGETFNVVRGMAAPYGFDTVSCAANAPSDAVIKTGSGALRLTSIPSDVKRFGIQNGRVTLSPVLRASDVVPSTGTNDIYAVIPNASFENEDMSAWTLAGSGSMRLATPHGDWCGHKPHDGSYALNLHSSKGAMCSARVSVTVPVKGKYELSFWGSGRRFYGIGQYIISFTKGSVTKTCDEVDVFAYSSASGYALHRLLTPELDAGKWTMKIQSIANTESASTFDDFKMRLVTEELNADGAWRLPNGGFENFAETSIWSGGRNTSYGSCSLDDFTYSSSNVVQQWTFTQGGDGVSGAPSVGISHVAMVERHQFWHNASLDNRFGDKRLAFYSDGGTATSDAFTPPAGTWKLRFKSAFAGAGADYTQWHSTSMTKLPLWSATATVNGGEPIELGSVKGTTFNSWGIVTMPVEILVSEGDSVVIAIRQTDPSGAGFIDDVELVPNVVQGNLVADGGFENATWDGASAWQRDIPGLGGRTDTSADSYVVRHAYTNSPTQYGYDRCEGDHCLRLCGNPADSAWQDVEIPSNGLYRLTFRARSRVSISGTDVGRLPIRVWMANGGATNEIGRTAVDGGEFRPFTYFWRAPSAGTYRLGFQGASAEAEERSTMIDGVSLTPAAGELLAETPDVPEDIEISVARGAELALDFPGTMKVGRLRVNGHAVYGTIRASDAPGVISGQGAIETTLPPLGVTVIVY